LIRSKKLKRKPPQKANALKRSKAVALYIKETIISADILKKKNSDNGRHFTQEKEKKKKGIINLKYLMLEFVSKAFLFIRNIIVTVNYTKEFGKQMFLTAF